MGKCSSGIFYRAVARSENPGGGHVVISVVPPLVEIGLTDQPKTQHVPPLAISLFYYKN